MGLEEGADAFGWYRESVETHRHGFQPPRSLEPLREAQAMLRVAKKAWNEAETIAQMRSAEADKMFWSAAVLEEVAKLWP